MEENNTPDLERTEGISALTGKKEKSSAGRFAGWSTIWGKEGDHKTPFMTRIWIGRLRLHIFHRPDQDPDCHDHPWDFWTFPLTSYVEEVALPVEEQRLVVDEIDVGMGEKFALQHIYTKHIGYSKHRQIVPAFQLNHRPAEHCHRVLGRYSRKVLDLFDEIISMRASEAATRTIPFEPYFDQRKIITIVWRGRSRRKWGFLKLRDGRWCWTPWKEYVFGAGKSAACE